MLFAYSRFFNVRINPEPRTKNKDKRQKTKDKRLRAAKLDANHLRNAQSSNFQIFKFSNFQIFKSSNLRKTLKPETLKPETLKL